MYCITLPKLDAYTHFHSSKIKSLFHFFKLQFMGLLCNYAHCVFNMVISNLYVTIKLVKIYKINFQFSLQSGLLWRNLDLNGSNRRKHRRGNQAKCRYWSLRFDHRKSIETKKRLPKSLILGKLEALFDVHMYTVKNIL